jgi:hypothetical protein
MYVTADLLLGFLLRYSGFMFHAGLVLIDLILVICFPFGVDLKFIYCVVEYGERFIRRYVQCARK